MLLALRPVGDQLCGFEDVLGRFEGTLVSMSYAAQVLPICVSTSTGRRGPSAPGPLSTLSIPSIMGEGHASAFSASSSSHSLLRMFRKQLFSLDSAT